MAAGGREERAHAQEVFGAELLREGRDEGPLLVVGASVAGQDEVGPEPLLAERRGEPARGGDGDEVGSLGDDVERPIGAIGRRLLQGLARPGRADGRDDEPDLVPSRFLPSGCDLERPHQGARERSVDLGQAPILEPRARREARERCRPIPIGSPSCVAGLPAPLA